MVDSRESTVLAALEAAVGIRTGDLGSLFTDDVKGWSPNLRVSSIEELKEIFDERDDAFSNTQVALCAFDAIGNKAFAEWRLAADHTGPLALGDDEILEATGRQVLLAGAIIAEFRSDRICEFRNYFDDAALLEQLVVG